MVEKTKGLIIKLNKFLNENRNAMGNYELVRYRHKLSDFNGRELAIERNELVARNLELNRLINSFKLKPATTLQSLEYKIFIVAEHNRTISDNKQKLTEVKRAVKLRASLAQYWINFPNYV